MAAAPAVCDLLQEWSFRYDGHKSPIEFVERLEWVADLHDVPFDDLVGAIPTVLEGKARAWFMVCSSTNATWFEFKRNFLRFFLPARYLERLNEEIRQRRRQDGENSKDYWLAMRVLKHRAKSLKELRLETASLYLE